MPTLLLPNEYDITYFDGLKARDLGMTRHPAGYSKYTREIAYGLKYTSLLRKGTINTLAGKKILELGCAKGYLVQRMRNEFGIDAYGIDFSSYAISEAPSDVVSYVSVGDVRTALSAFSTNQFDYVLSFMLIECIPLDDLPDAIIQMDRISSKKQIHVTDSTHASDYYNVLPLSTWEAYFPKGTILVEGISEEVMVVT